MTAKNRPRRFRLKASLARLLTTKRRKTAAEKMRLAQWDDAMTTLNNAAVDLGTAANEQRIRAAVRAEPAFTPMRADFEWAKRVTKQLKQLADEIERYT